MSFMLRYYLMGYYMTTRITTRVLIFGVIVLYAIAMYMSTILNFIGYTNSYYPPVDYVN